MKRIMKVSIIAVFLLMAPVMMFAQPHPNGGNAPGVGNHPVGGSAPIGNGTFVLITLAIAYGGRKVYELRHPGLASHS